MTNPCQNNAHNVVPFPERVVVPFPKRVVVPLPKRVVVPLPKRNVASHPWSKLAQIEQENAELRRYAADLALQIQHLNSTKE